MLHTKVLEAEFTFGKTKLIVFFIFTFNPWYIHCCCPVFTMGHAQCFGTQGLLQLFIC